MAAVCIGISIGWMLAPADALAQATADFEVTNTSNSGAGSLRQAILDANASAATTKTITFSLPANETIDLTSDLPEIDDDVTINGSTAMNLTVDGSAPALTRILRIGADTTVRDLGLEGAPIEIATGSSLSFDVSTEEQFDDVITDGGRLVKIGDGTLTLRGANDYTGGTLVSRGTLRGDTTSLQGNITNNANLVFDQTSAGEYMGIIDGTGAVSKTGAGEVRFSGANTYSGGTTISAGSLRGDAGSLQGDIAVAGGASVIFDQAVDATYAGNLSGMGSFSKKEAGTLTLTGTNTIAGQSSLDAGRLKGGFASIPQRLSTASGTRVNFDHTDDGTYAGAITGMGSVLKTGAGKLTFSGTHTYSGTTTVSAGTLSANPLRLPNQVSSSIVNNAALIFNATSNGTYRGVISGTGTLSKTGAAMLTLTGVHSFTGLTSISAGRLDVDGSLAGGVAVGASGTLGGTGSIAGAVSVDGILAPGKSVGTLGVGSATFAPGSRFEVEVDEAMGAADQLVASGNVDLGGATLVVDPGSGNYGTPLDVTIVTAGAVLNDFAPFQDDRAFLDITYMLTATTVELRVARNAMTPLDFAQTPNQVTIANALEAALMAGADPLIDASLNSLTDDQVPGALDSMTGESLTQFATTRLATAERFGRSLDARIRDHQSAGGGALFAWGSRAAERRVIGAADDPTRAARAAVPGVALLGAGAIGAPGAGSESGPGLRIRTWIDGSAIHGDVDGNANESDFDYDIWGGSLGSDLRVADHWIVGLAGGYARSQLDFSARPGDGDVDTYQGALYAGYVDPRFYLGVSGRFAYNEMDGKRDIAFGALNTTARADLDGFDYGARLDGAISLLDLGGVVLQPTASVGYTRLTQDDVTEDGAAALNLAIEDSDLDSLVTGVGMRARARWEIGSGMWMVPELHGRWLHEFLDTDRVIDAQLVSAPLGASSFQIQGVELPRDSGSVGLAWSVIANSAWSLTGSYDAVLSEDLVQHIGSLTLHFTW